MRAARLLAPAALLAVLGATALHAAPLPTGSTPVPVGAESGTFSLLTLNVAGLPEILSSGHPAENTKTMGERVNAYDIVNVQEDFNYHADLYSTDLHPYRTPTSGGVPFGSGLNTVSRFPFDDLVRVKWDKCHGTDCLTPKGFTFVRVRLDEGVYLDLYNAHPNAGTADEDLAARRSNISQLSTYIAAHSSGNAVIVAADTNTRYTRSGDNIRELVANNFLTDAWVQQERGGIPPEQGAPGLVCDPANVVNSCEVVDKVLFRGNSLINLKLNRLNNEDANFHDAAGAMLSDHYPHAAWFTWALNPELRFSDTWGGPHGDNFTDIYQIAPGVHTNTVSIHAGSRVDQVGVTLANGTSPTHGGAGGTAASLNLGAGEYVTQVRLDSVVKDGNTRIGYIQLATNRGRTLTGGKATGQSVTYTAPAGFGLGGFYGRSGDEIDRLGVIWTPAAG